MSYSKSSIWIDYEFKNYYKDSKLTGLRLHYDNEVSASKRNNLNSLFTWLRKKYYFPLRCNVFLLNQEKFKSKTPHSFCQGIFFPPEGLRRAKMPQIYIAINTDKEFLYFTIFHELTHYYQWYFKEDEKCSNRSLEIESNKWAQWLLNEYLSNH